MARVLLIHPSKWGRGITALWIPSHSAVLKEKGHDVRLFDCTFFSSWAVNEVDFNTSNRQYRPTKYAEQIKYHQGDIVKELQRSVDEFDPDVIFWSALSSHIHGEGEYVNIQYGHKLVESIRTRAVRVAAGLQPTAAPEAMFSRFPAADYFIRGESEFVLPDLIDCLRGDREASTSSVPGLVSRTDGKIRLGPRQDIIGDLDTIPPYDYDLFEEQAFLRPYNGKVVRAVDYEMSRGCIYACEYCVETVIQRYYGFDSLAPGKGTIRNPKKYLRNKSAKRVFDELTYLHYEKGIQLFRCQDTNFLTIHRPMLLELAELIRASTMDIMLYVETRPEGVNPTTIEVLKALRVDGVGMGVEMSTESFRQDKLRRFAAQDKIIRAFQLLREAGIRRTAYNIIGLPEQDEDSVLETIEFNRELCPDNVTVAFYSPYIGTGQQRRAQELGYFDDYEYHVDGQLRSLSKHSRLDVQLLNFYKRNFVRLVHDGPTRLAQLKAAEGVT